MSDQDWAPAELSDSEEAELSGEVAGQDDLENYESDIQDAMDTLQAEEIQQATRQADEANGFTEEESLVLDGPPAIDRRPPSERFFPTPVEENPDPTPQRASQTVQTVQTAEYKAIIDGAEAEADAAQEERMDDLAFENDFSGDGAEYRVVVTNHIQAQEAEYLRSNPTYHADISAAKTAYISGRAAQLEADGIHRDDAHHRAAVEVRRHAWDEAARAATEGTDFAKVLHRQSRQLLDRMRTKKGHGAKDADDIQRGQRSFRDSWMPK